MTWPLVPLSEVADVRLGRQRSPKNHSGTEMRPYIRAANVTWAGLSLADVKTMNFTEQEMQTYRMMPGDIVLSEASGSPSEVGKPAIWAGEISDCGFQNTLIRVRARRHEPRFLLYFFRYLALEGRFVEHARGVGIHHLGRTRLAAWPTPLPPLDEQRRIVDLLEDHLSRLDAAEKSLHTARIRSDSLLKTSLWSATHDLTGSSPVQLQQVAEVRLGRQRSPANHQGDRMRSYLRAANVGWDVLRLDDVKQMQFTEEEEATYRLEPGDILLTEASGSPAEVGKSALYEGSPSPVCFQNTVLRVRCHSVHPEFMQKYLLAEALNGRFMPESRGVGINHLGRGRLAGLVVQVPSEDRQQSAVAACQALTQAVGRVQGAASDQMRRTTTLRKALLTAAFSGRLTGATDVSEVAERIDA